MLDALILEDDDASREALASWLRGEGLSCRVAGDLEGARRLVAEQVPDLALVDLELPDGSGLDLLRELSASQDCEVVMFSGQTTVDAAIEALRLGARDFLTKPVEMHRLEALVGSLARTAELRHEVRALRSQLKRLGRFGELIGESAVMREVYEAIERVAPTDETVMILGPTGTGKELTASTIHRLSRRSSESFVPVNCSAVPENLLESQFFGHERGAFTGAERRHKGFFEQAHRGTLFLDEITEMPADLQAKLLRVLEDGVVKRLGATESFHVDVRVIAATNRDPEESVEEGKLRRDLLYRLLVFPLHLPKLIERGEDLVLLAQTFLERLNGENETTKEFTGGALSVMRRHDWPGNVRELENVVRRAYVMAETHIDVEHIPFERRDLSPVPGGVADSSPRDDDLVIPAGASIKEAEQALIEATLADLDGNKKAAAERLGISLKTLYARLKVYSAQRGE